MTQSADQNVTIIGSGIGGLCAAIAMARNGARVQIYERAKAFQDIGAGIQVSPNAVRALTALGVDFQNSFASRVRRTQFYRDDGRRLLHLDQNAPAQVPYYQIHRADFITLLADQAQSHGVDVHFGAAVSAADFSRDHLIIAADGVKSAHRTDGHALRYSGYCAWRALIMRPERFPTTENRVYLGKKRHLVLYPLRNGTVLNIVGVAMRANPPDIGWDNLDNPAHLRAAFAGFAPAVIDNLDRVDKTTIWPLNIHAQPDMIGKSGTFLVGDSAQAMVPFMAQGAAMAIEDAYVLAKLAKRYCGADLAREYQALRAPRRARVMATSLRNGQLFHESRPIIRPMMHMGMAALGQLNSALLNRRYRWIYDYDVTRLQL